MSGWAVIVFREERAFLSPSELEVGSSDCDSCHCRTSVTSTSSRSSTFRLSGREDVDFWVDLVPALVRGGLGKINCPLWSFRTLVSDNGETLTKRSSSPGLVRVVKGLENCAGGGEESPDGVGEVNSLRLVACGKGDTVPEGSSF